MKRYTFRKVFVIMGYIILPAIFIGGDYIVGSILNIDNDVGFGYAIFATILLTTFISFFWRGYIEINDATFVVYTGFGKVGYLTIEYNDITKLRYIKVTRTLIVHYSSGKKMSINRLYRNSNDMLQRLIKLSKEYNNDIDIDSWCNNTLLKSEN